MNTKKIIQVSRLFAFAVCSALTASAADSDHSAHAGGLGKPLPPGWEPAVHDRMIQSYTLLNRAEFRTGEATDAAVIDAEGWIGGDYQRFWWKAEGEQETKEAEAGEIEVQALYGRLIAPFWDFQAGVRHDRAWGPGPDRDRTFLVLGLEGLAPYWFELEPALFVSEDGDISARLTASYDLLLTQRLVLQPRLDLNAAVQDVPEFGLGGGFNDIEIGLRLRYDLRRQFSPYIGVTWRRALGETAGLERRAGDDISTTSVVFGLRTWF